MNELIIYTDGASRYNPGPGGYAGIILDKNKKRGVKGRELITTNNIMELTGVIESLKQVLNASESYKENPDIHIKVNTDSAYIVNTINNKWYENWIKSNWINSKKEPVKNRELWEELLSLIENFKNIEFIKVKGHSTDKLNNLCDEIATKEADEAKLELISEAKEEGILLDDTNIKEYLNSLTGENEDILENVLEENNEKEDNNYIIQELSEKEERQSETITSLMFENTKLKKKIRELEDEVKSLKEKLDE